MILCTHSVPNAINDFSSLFLFPTLCVFVCISISISTLNCHMSKCTRRITEMKMNSIHSKINGLMNDAIVYSETLIAQHTQEARILTCVSTFVSFISFVCSFVYTTSVMFLNSTQCILAFFFYFLFVGYEMNIVIFMIMIICAVSSLLCRLSSFSIFYFFFLGRLFLHLSKINAI